MLSDKFTNTSRCYANMLNNEFTNSGPARARFRSGADRLTVIFPDKEYCSL